VTLPHGYQNGVLLPHVAAFNRAVVPPAAIPYLDGLAELYDNLDFAAQFAPGEVDEAAAQLMIDAALGNPFRLNNRRKADESDLRALLAEAGAAVPDTTSHTRY
jgi:alcohol dehydrogenase class IV